MKIGHIRGIIAFMVLVSGFVVGARATKTTSRHIFFAIGNIGKAQKVDCLQWMIIEELDTG